MILMFLSVSVNGLFRKANDGRYRNWQLSGTLFPDRHYDFPTGSLASQREARTLSHVY